ncbi:Genetic suppressor element 1 [Rhodotorula toruloides]
MVQWPTVLDFVKSLVAHAAPNPPSTPGGTLSQTKSAEIRAAIKQFTALPNANNILMCPAAILSVPDLGPILSDVTLSALPNPQRRLDQFEPSLRDKLAAAPTILALSQNDDVTIPQDEKLAEEFESRIGDVVRLVWGILCGRRVTFASTPAPSGTDAILKSDRQIIVDDPTTDSSAPSASSFGSSASTRSANEFGVSSCSSATTSGTTISLPAVMDDADPLPEPVLQHDFSTSTPTATAVAEFQDDEMTNTIEGVLSTVTDVQPHAYGTLSNVFITNLKGEGGKNIVAKVTNDGTGSLEALLKEQEAYEQLGGGIDGLTPRHFGTYFHDPKTFNLEMKAGLSLLTYEGEALENYDSLQLEQRIAIHAAFSRLHTLRLCHHNPSARNVVRGSDGTYRIVDFGRTSAADHDVAACSRLQDLQIALGLSEDSDEEDSDDESEDSDGDESF